MIDQKLPAVFGVVIKFFVIASCIAFLSGCIRYPRAEAPARAGYLRDKGYTRRADETLRDAEGGGGWDIRSRSLESEMRNDMYHSPELVIPGEKRKYDIRFSTS